MQKNDDDDDDVTSSSQQTENKVDVETFFHN